MSLSITLMNLVKDMLIKFQGLTYAEIIKFYPDYTADIKFLKFRKIKTETGVENLNYPKAYNVPVLSLGGNGFTINPSYTKGDIVAVVFSASRIEQTNKRTSDKDSLLSRDNCVVLGGLLTDRTKSDIPLVIGSENVNIEMSKTKILFTVGTTSFKIDASGATVTVGGVSVNLLTHLHGTGVGPTTPPTPGT